MKKLFLFVLSITSFQFITAQGWDDKASLPDEAEVRHHPVTFELNGKGYLVAGAEASSASLGDFYAYDPNTDTWQTKANFPGTSRGFSYGVSTPEKGYMGFGYYYDPGTGEEAYLNDLWEYNPVTDEWSELASCPCQARIHPAMVQVNDKIYVGLGGSEFGDLNDWWEYDIATDTWTEKTDFPSTQRHHPYYFGIDGEVYVGFGHHTFEIFNDFYKYSPETDSWTTLADFPEQGRVAGTQFAVGGKGYILSGQGEDHGNLPTGEFWEYDPEIDEWEELPAHPGGGRWAPGSFVIDYVVYLTCGEANIGERKDLIAYELPTFAGQNEMKTETFTLYPNPATSAFYVNISGNNYEKLSLYTTTGTKVWETQNWASSISVAQLAAGIYIVELENETGVLRKKLLVQ